MQILPDIINASDRNLLLHIIYIVNRPKRSLVFTNIVRVSTHTGLNFMSSI